MAQTKSRQRQFADLQDRPIRDVDPDNELAPPSDSDGSADSDAEQAETKAATDHYVAVGKSKLRTKGTTSLGPQYRGARVSRADLEAESDEEGEEEDEEDEFQDAKEELGSAGSSSNESGDEVFDDPETADLEADDDGRDVEIDSDEAFDDSDEERFKDFTFRGSSKVLPGGKGKRIPRATAADFLGSDSGEGEEQSQDGGSDEDELDSEGESLDEEDYSDDEMVAKMRKSLIDDEAEESDEDEDEDGDLDGFIVDSDEDEEGEEEDDDEDADEDMDGDSADEKRKPSKNAAVDREEMVALADLVSAGRKTVSNSLTEGQQKDIAKGNAIRHQRKAFDALLNVRIRLQKSLVAMNTLPVAAEASEDQQEEEPYEAAEAAALKLWNTIDSFRSNLPGVAAASASKKRKRSEATAETSSEKIWARIEAAEQRTAPRRRAVLQNWAQKANNIRAVDRSSRKFSSAAEKTLVARLDEEMAAPERLVKRTRTPRSCAPAQVSRKVNEDDNIYDDADFYQLLLKELVDQRTADTSAASGAAGGANAAATIRFAAVKEAKAKKHVDTKASKGRKMRFNVHDKLQNFMAPEDRRGWEQSAIDRLFGTLFGQKMVLNEDDEGGVSDEDEMDGVDAAEAGLKLFRS
ncbi:apoptosis antagonizing transcription factor-domain-containing protein [Microdochium bolleyi]|uniref:Protein BFR2 n=1 Tax=Microdochium bolleyi TaxID=196109 RepID=A0A136IY43_9PEZI|nr:apoptosis antagonizing transcription factor-domain-containing protein [Microdochium bolleyi]